MSRQLFVWRDGKFVDVTDYEDPKNSNKSPAIHFDDTIVPHPMKPGEVVTSKKELRAIAKANDLVELGEEKDYMQRRAAEVQKERENRYHDKCMADISRRMLGCETEKERALVKYRRENNGRWPEGWD